MAAKFYTAPDGEAFDSVEALNEYVESRGFYRIESKRAEKIVRGNGSISGNKFELKDITGCQVLLLDHSGYVHGQNLEQCSIFIGPCEGTVKLEGCKDCIFTIACQQLVLERCSNCSFFVFAAQNTVLGSGRREADKAGLSDDAFADVAAATALPIACTDLTFAPFNGSYPNLERHMMEAKLYECKNNWDKVLDCTFDADETTSKSNKTKSMSWKKFRVKRVFAKREKNDIEMTTSKVRKLSIFSKVALRRATERFDTHGAAGIYSALDGADYDKFSSAMQGASSGNFRFKIPEQYESLRGKAGLSALLKSLLLRRQGGVVLDDLVGDDYDTTERESPDPAMIHTQHHLHRGPGPWLRLEVVLNLVMMEDNPREFVNQALHHLGMTVGAIPHWRVTNGGEERIPESIPKPTMKHFYDIEMADPTNLEHNSSKGSETAASPKKGTGTFLAPLNPVRGGEKSASIPVADLVRSSLGKSLAGAKAAATVETSGLDKVSDDQGKEKAGDLGKDGEEEEVKDDENDEKEVEGDLDGNDEDDKVHDGVPTNPTDSANTRVKQESDIKEVMKDEVLIVEEDIDAAEEDEEEDEIQAEQSSTRGVVFESLGSALTSARDSAERGQQDKGEESFSGTSNGLAGVPLSQYVRVQHALEGNDSFGDRVPSRRAQRRPVTAGSSGEGGKGGRGSKRPATADCASASTLADEVSAMSAGGKNLARQLSPSGKHVRPVSSSREQRRRHHPNGPEDVSPSGQKGNPIPSTTADDEDFVVMLKDDDAEILIEEREAMATIDETKNFPILVPVELVSLLAIAEGRGIEISKWLSNYDAEATGRISSTDLRKALTGLALGVGVGLDSTQQKIIEDAISNESLKSLFASLNDGPIGNVDSLPYTPLLHLVPRAQGGEGVGTKAGVQRAAAVKSSRRPTSASTKQNNLTSAAKVSRRPKSAQARVPGARATATSSVHSPKRSAKSPRRKPGTTSSSPKRTSPKRSPKRRPKRQDGKSGKRPQSANHNSRSTRATAPRTTARPSSAGGSGSSSASPSSKCGTKKAKRKKKKKTFRSEAAELLGDEIEIEELIDEERLDEMINEASNDFRGSLPNQLKSIVLQRKGFSTLKQLVVDSAVPHATVQLVDNATRDEKDEWMKEAYVTLPTLGEILHRAGFIVNSAEDDLSLLSREVHGVHLESTEATSTNIPEMYIHRLELALQEIEDMPSFMRIAKAAMEGGKRLTPYVLRAAFIAADASVIKGAVSSLATAFGLGKAPAAKGKAREAEMDANLAKTLGLNRAAFIKALRNLIESLEIGSGHGSLFDEDLVDFFDRDGRGERYDWGDFKWALEATLFGIPSTFVVQLKAGSSDLEREEGDSGGDDVADKGATETIQNYGHAIATIYPSVRFVHLASFIRYLGRMKLHRNLHWDDWCAQKEVQKQKELKRQLSTLYKVLNGTGTIEQLLSGSAASMTDLELRQRLAMEEIGHLLQHICDHDKARYEEIFPAAERESEAREAARAWLEGGDGQTELRSRLAELVATLKRKGHEEDVKDARDLPRTVVAKEQKKLYNEKFTNLRDESAKSVGFLCNLLEKYTFDKRIHASSNSLNFVDWLKHRSDFRKRQESAMRAWSAKKKEQALAAKHAETVGATFAKVEEAILTMASSCTDDNGRPSSHINVNAKLIAFKRSVKDTRGLGVKKRFLTSRGLENNTIYNFERSKHTHDQTNSVVVSAMEVHDALGDLLFAFKGHPKTVGMALEMLDSKNSEFWNMDLSTFAAKEHEKRVAAEKARKRIQAAVRAGTGGRKTLRGDESVLLSVSSATKESLVSSNNLLEHKSACADAHKKWLADKKKKARAARIAKRKEAKRKAALEHKRLQEKRKKFSREKWEARIEAQERAARRRIRRSRKDGALLANSDSAVKLRGRPAWESTEEEK